MFGWTQRIRRPGHTHPLKRTQILGACAIAAMSMGPVDLVSQSARESADKGFFAIVHFEAEKERQGFFVDPSPLRRRFAGSMPDLDDRLILKAKDLQRRVETLEQLGVGIVDAVPLRAACASLMSLPGDRGREGCPATPEVVLVLVGMLEKNDDLWQQHGMLVEYDPRGRTVYGVIYHMAIQNNDIVSVEMTTESVSH